MIIVDIDFLGQMFLGAKNKYPENMEHQFIIGFKKSYSKNSDLLLIYHVFNPLLCLIFYLIFLMRVYIALEIIFARILSLSFSLSRENCFCRCFNFVAIHI